MNCFVATLSGILFSTSVLMAQPAGRGGGDVPGLWGPKEFKELNLTKTQKDKVQEIREGSKEKGKALREAAKEARKNIKVLLASPASKEEISKAFDVSQGKQVELAKFMFTQMLQIREILTPEQRTKLKSMRDERRDNE